MPIKRPASILGYPVRIPASEALTAVVRVGIRPFGRGILPYIAEQHAAGPLRSGKRCETGACCSPSFELDDSAVTKLCGRYEHTDLGCVHRCEVHTRQCLRVARNTSARNSDPRRAVPVLNA